MKEKLDNFKVWFKKTWADERGKALIKLGLYCLFVLFATFTATATYKYYSNEEKTENKTQLSAMEKYKQLNSYLATYVVNGVSYPYTSANKQIIKVNDVSYFIDADKLTNVLDSSLAAPEFDFKFWYFTPTFIIDMIKNGSSEYTTSYTDGKKVEAYLVPLKYFATKYTGNVIATEDSSIFDDKNIEILITEKDDTVTKVEINVTSYYAFINNLATNYNIEIDYQ